MGESIIKFMKNLLKKLASKLHLHITGVEPPEHFLSTLTTLLILLATGTTFYHYQEGWNVLDSLYFTVVTIATVGYGDLHPTKEASKIFTMVLIFMGVGLGLFVISSLADSLQKGRVKRQQHLKKFLEKI